MKKWICTLAVLLLIVSVSLAETPDWAQDWRQLIPLNTQPRTWLAMNHEDWSEGWSLLDETGQVIREHYLDGIGDFSEGVAWVREGSKYGYLLKNGELLTEICFQEASSFENGIARVKIDDKYGFIDASGEYVIAPEYDLARGMENSCIIVGMLGEPLGTEVSGEPEYERFWGVIDRHGNEILPMEYDDLFFADPAEGSGVLYAELDGRRLLYSVENGTVEALLSFPGSVNIDDYLPKVENRLAMPDEGTDIIWDGSAELPLLDSANSLFPACSAVVEACYPGVTRYGHPESIAPVITCSGQERSLERLAYGLTDVIFIPKPGADRIEAAAKLGVQLEITPIAYDALVFAVHSENMLEGLSSGDLRAIYSGSVTDWAQLGGDPEKEMIAFQNPDNSDSQLALIEFLDGADPAAAPMGGEGWDWGRLSYRNLPGAIGFSHLSILSRDMEKDAPVKLLAVDGVQASAENIRSGSYPVVQSLCAVTRKGEENPNVRILLDWLLSAQGQELLERNGYVRLEG